MIRRPRSLLLVVLTSLAVAAPAVAYMKPVDAPLVDPFRAPDSPYGPGNRGHEYDTDPGQEVVASEAGIVAFAGEVGGVLFVVVAHQDGLRTTYGHLRTSLVEVGQRVNVGERLGTSGERIHFGVRRNDEYVDPADVLNDGNSAHLIPVAAE